MNEQVIIITLSVFLFVVTIFIIYNKYHLSLEYHKRSIRALIDSANDLEHEGILYETNIRFGEPNYKIFGFHKTFAWGFASLKVCKNGLLINPITTIKFGLFFDNITEIQISNSHGNKGKLDRYEIFYNEEVEEVIPFLVKPNEELLTIIKNQCSCEIKKIFREKEHKDDWLIR